MEAWNDLSEGFVFTCFIDDLRAHGGRDDDGTATLLVVDPQSDICVKERRGL